MFNYPEMTTAELIDLLFKEEDRVTLDHIMELVNRGEEAAAPLREILANEDYWYEGEHGEFWIEMHAYTILSAMRDEKAFPTLLEMVLHAYFSDNEWVMEIVASALGRFGVMAVDPMIEFLDKYREAHHDNRDYSYARYRVAGALTRIAKGNPEVIPRVLDAFCRELTDAQEDDSVYLSFIVYFPVYLDREKGIEAVRTAYDRGAIDETINGDYDDFIAFLNRPQTEAFRDLEDNLFDFYRDDRIASRQRRWKSEGQKKNKDYPKGLLPFALGEEPGSVSVPEGYSMSSEGKIVRHEKVGRNDPCPCGSGKKYKKCHGAQN